MSDKRPPSSVLAIEQVERWAFQRGLIYEGSLCDGAVFSPDRSYRYLLWRHASPSAPFAAFAMLNPSSATARQNDPTIRRCLDYVDTLRQPLLVWNLFALIATDPAALDHSADPVGPHGDEAIDLALSLASPTIAAWGVRGASLGRAGLVLRRVVAAECELHVLQLTQSGQPAHPLYLPKALLPQPWNFPF